MSTNPIIAELHAIRREYAERFHQDLHAICADARRKQGQQGRRVVASTPKPSIGRPTHIEDAGSDNRPMASGQ
ncbi:hypothetical protein G3480_24840 [Thiorhodococcus mannitoliphagus]|uniref:Uncharacterized protein n=1 Tax=Thiorhodococcus mannitoliphagus TaxID=329406 RepID=A0A6P1E328_9GAMM|nr:hypothetical protein [Thiorhodococcus mannitoliphagus]NEX23476.1 hypothetical protein [Thiorhodococcus mannitoliphagus]